MADLTNLAEWREHREETWESYESLLDGWAYHRGRGEISGLDNDLARMIDFLAGRVRELEAQVLALRGKVGGPLL